MLRILTNAIENFANASERLMIETTAEHVLVNVVTALTSIPSELIVSKSQVVCHAQVRTKGRLWQRQWQGKV